MYDKIHILEMFQDKCIYEYNYMSCFHLEVRYQTGA